MMWGFLVVTGFFENVRRLWGYNFAYNYTITSSRSRRKFVLMFLISTSSSCDSGSVLFLAIGGLLFKGCVVLCYIACFDEEGVPPVRSFPALAVQVLGLCSASFILPKVFDPPFLFCLYFRFPVGFVIDPPLMLLSRGTRFAEGSYR